MKLSDVYNTGASGYSGYSGMQGGGSKTLYVFPSGYSTTGYPYTVGSEVSGCSFAVVSGHCYDMRGWIICGTHSSGTSNVPSVHSIMFVGPAMSDLSYVQGTTVGDPLDPRTGCGGPVNWTDPQVRLPAPEILDGYVRGASPGTILTGMLKPVEDGWVETQLMAGYAYDADAWITPAYSGKNGMYPSGAMGGFVGRSWMTIEDLGTEVGRA
jgi:hypothetical protein